MRVYSLATGTVTIRRGTSANAYGDPITGPTSGAVVATGVLASIQEVNQRVMDPATQMPRVVRGYMCSVQSDVDLRTNDVIVEETAPRRAFMVDDCSQVGGAGWTGDLRADLRRLDTGAAGG